MPVLASLGIQAKKLSPPQRDHQGKKDAFVHVCSASPIFLCLGGSLPTSSAFNTSNNGCHYNCFSLSSQSRPIMNQAGVHAMSIPTSVSLLTPENVEPSSGKTILFYCTGTRLC